MLPKLESDFLRFQEKKEKESERSVFPGENPDKGSNTHKNEWDPISREVL